MDSALVAGKVKPIVFLQLKLSLAESQKEENMDKYQCAVCGYIYDPAEGDADSGIERGTSFEDIPDDWVCPICGADKSQFEKV